MGCNQCLSTASFKSALFQKEQHILETDRQKSDGLFISVLFLCIILMSVSIEKA